MSESLAVALKNVKKVLLLFLKMTFNNLIDLHLEETANQNQGVVPGEISQFNTLCTF
jgi:hypothetical protein